MSRLAFALCVAVLAGPACAAAHRFTIPTETYQLPNGLKVVLSQDREDPVVTVTVGYHVGWRLEQRGRTGFAHLFEHLMFEGSTHLDKGEFVHLVDALGGALNGSTRPDFTVYYETVPSAALEKVLWAEADRMGGLAIDQARLDNQKAVVSGEVRQFWLNAPYGGFPWDVVPQVANQNWFNTHTGIGELADIEAATLEDARAFFAAYYAPSNAVVVVCGDFDREKARGWIAREFGRLPARPAPNRPDLTEPPQLTPRQATRTDTYARRPALAAAWHLPPRHSRDWYAVLVLRAVLGDRDGRLYAALVHGKGATSSVDADFGWSLAYDGTNALFVSFIHDAGFAADDLVATVQGELDRLAATPIDETELARARAKAHASFYDELDGLSFRGRYLATTLLVDGDLRHFEHMDDELDRVTAADVRAAAARWLSAAQRTVVKVTPAAKVAE